jgi:hypothetical protein
MIRTLLAPEVDALCLGGFTKECLDMGTPCARVAQHPKSAREALRTKYYARALWVLSMATSGPRAHGPGAHS